MYHQLENGWIEVITGPMFAGKSDELIRRVRTLTYAKKNIICFKPKIDNRYHETDITSHAGGSFEAYSVSSTKEIKELIKEEHDVVAIDEIQFFSSDIIELLDMLANQGRRVIVAGLDKDFRGEGFSFMPIILAKAEFVTKLYACCRVCGKAASMTQRLIDNKEAPYDSPIILVGASESYEARCRKHHKCPKN